MSGPDERRDPCEPYCEVVTTSDADMEVCPDCGSLWRLLVVREFDANGSPYRLGRGWVRL